jgi:dTDP-4-amino-4,6-dideoxygalactose transaminase
MGKRSKINLSQVYIDQKIKRKVLATIDSGSYILGSNCQEFEKKFAKFIGKKYGVLSNSATSVMQLTIMALGIGKEDEVIVPSLTAFPTIEPIFHVGAKPIFVDIDSTGNLDADLIEAKITKKTKALLPVHLYGNPVNLEKIAFLAKKHKLILLEDACQAHGAKYQNKKVGSFGLASFFSFYPSKNLTFLGDGGIMLTNDEKLAQKVRMLRDHGRSDKYLHQIVGFNMRANEIQAAIGLAQLEYLNKFNKRRRQIAKLYNQLLKKAPIELPLETPKGKSVYHMYVIRTKDRDRLTQHLKEKNIFTGIHYPIPCHLQPAVIKIIGKIKLPKVEKFCNQILSLPIHPLLTNREVEIVAKEIINFFER